MKPPFAGFFKGATSWEWYIGPLWGRFLRRRYWCGANLTEMIELGWDSTWRQEV